MNAFKQQRCKIESLTLINWNGYFARTLELDPRVTALSGGNGAGKSTLMAALMVALVPDLSLLNFRNTTEAGSVRASKDRGLLGKLNPGFGYALFKARSGNQLFLAGVEIQTLSSREGKLELKPFIVTHWLEKLDPIEVLTQPLKDNEGLSQVLGLSEAAERLKQQHQVILKRCTSIGDYHQQLFHLGFLYKPFRQSSERSKLYRLLEASLYGGLSSTIVQALKDYLLTEPVGIRRAFQELESAVQENRLTLVALQETEKARTLFKSLLGHTSTYVSAEYMRNLNRLREEQRNFRTLRAQLQALEQEGNQLKSSLRTHRLKHEAIEGNRAELQEKLEKQRHRRGLSETALKQLERQQEILLHIGKMERRAVEIEAERSKTETELRQQSQELKRLQSAQDELRESLANHAMLLSQHQKQSVQYAQAWQAWDTACLQGHVQLQQKPLSPGFPEAVEKACQQAEAEHHDAQKLQLQRLEKLKHRELFERGRDEALKKLHRCQPALEAAGWAEKAAGPSELRLQIASAWEAQNQASARLSSLKQEEQQTFQKLRRSREQLHRLQRWQAQWAPTVPMDELQKREKLMELQNQQLHRISELELEAQREAARQAVEREAKLQSELELQALKKQQSSWQASMEAQVELKERFEIRWSGLEDFRECLKAERLKEREGLKELERFETELQRIQREHHELQSQSLGKLSESMESIATQFGGIPLAQLLEDVALESSSLCSALFEPFKNAVVVENPEAVKPKLQGLPSVILLSKSQWESFQMPHATGLTYETLPGGVWVKEGELNGWRYTPYPNQPWAGSASRAQQIEKLEIQRQRVQQHLEGLQREAQLQSRVLLAMESFFAQYGSVAFGQDLQESIRTCEAQLHTLQAQLQKRDAKLRAVQEELSNHQKAHQALLGFLESGTDFEGLEGLETAWRQLKKQITASETAQAWLQGWRSEFESALQTPAWYFETQDEISTVELQKAWQASENAAQQARAQLWVWMDLKSRLDHFHYELGTGSEQEPIQAEHAALKAQLQAQQVTIERLQQHLKQSRKAFEAARESFIRIEAELQSQREVLLTLQADLKPILSSLKALGAETSYSEIQGWLSSRAWEETQNALESAQRSLESHIAERSRIEAKLERQLERGLESRKGYQLSRRQHVQRHETWHEIRNHLQQDSRISNLYRPTLASCSDEALRRLADEALGALKSSSACPLELRKRLDGLETRSLSHLIHFYQLVLAYLQDRIRHDLFHHDHPLQALERMEAELQRLRQDLEQRETKLRIRSQSVAQLIQKAVQREQLRMEQLNHYLKGSRFGAIQAIRVQLKIKSTHELLLKAMLNPEASPQWWGTTTSEAASAPLHFFEQLGELYRRLSPESPELGRGHWNAHQMGESLLDYRRYLNLSIEVQRQDSGWIQAESGLLSTGEAIGAGMSMLMMVIQSWEEEGRRLRSQHQPFRLLFLDEASRLDGRSIATLGELCENLDCQLLLAAPEGMASVAGTTYHLSRKMTAGAQAHVSIVGIRTQSIVKSEARPQT